MREYKFRAFYSNMWHYISTVDKPVDGRGSHNFKGYEVSNGYILRKVKGHPRANKRGYYPEHRLVVENHYGKILDKNEVVHHIDGDRKNNDFDNLRVVTQSSHASLEMRGKRNPNGTLIAKDPIFEEIKFRLHDIDKGITKIYTLSKLIGTTFRRGKFQFRGRSTGLYDKNGKEIYEGDIIVVDVANSHPPMPDTPKVVEWWHGQFVFDAKRYEDDDYINFGWWVRSNNHSNQLKQIEVIGNIYENNVQLLYDRGNGQAP